MKPSTALNLLKASPQAFLQNNMLRCTARGDSGVYTVHFGTPDEFTSVPTGVGAPNENFRFDDNVGRLGESIPVKVHNVSMYSRLEQNFSLKKLPAYSLGGGPDYMITSQLNACAFCVMGDAASPVVAHIQPRDAAGLTGQGLKNSIETNGSFNGHNGGVGEVYGLQDYTNYATVVGVRIGGRWQIYGQAYNSTGAAGRITGVTRIL